MVKWSMFWCDVRIKIWQVRPEHYLYFLVFYTSLFPTINGIIYFPFLNYLILLPNGHRWMQVMLIGESTEEGSWHYIASLPCSSNCECSWKDNLVLSCINDCMIASILSSTEEGKMGYTANFKIIIQTERPSLIWTQNLNMTTINFSIDDDLLRGNVESGNNLTFQFNSCFCSLESLNYSRSNLLIHFIWFNISCTLTANSLTAHLPILSDV